jgi:hypothetical protein
MTHGFDSQTSSKEAQSSARSSGPGDYGGLGFRNLGSRQQSYSSSSSSLVQSCVQLIVVVAVGTGAEKKAATT